MEGLVEVLGRLVADPSFAAAVRLDPVAALADYRLSDDELDRVAAVLDLQPRAVRTFFTTGPETPGHGAPPER